MTSSRAIEEAQR